MFRWKDINDTGNDHGLAVDDLSIAWTASGAPSVTLTANNTSFGENAGATASTVTVTLSAPAGGDTVFDITDTDADDSEISTPATVTVLNGQTTATFNVAALTDVLADGNQAITVTVAKAGYTSGQIVLTVTDTTPVISLSANNTSLAENASNPASTVTVTLSAPVVGDTVFDIAENDTDDSEVSAPATVTVLNGQTTATFDVTVLNDLIPDGNQVVGFTVSKAGYVTGNLNLTVVDTAPTITLSAVPTSFSESGSSVLTVTLSPVQITATTVTVTASTGSADLTLANGGVVIIPANTASADLALTGVTDGVFDGTKVVTLTTSATGAQNGQTNVTVTDVDLSPVLFSQYYEGASNNKFIEIKNTSGSSLALATYHLANWTNGSAESWKTENAGVGGFSGSLSASIGTLAIPANGTILIANPSAALPTYAISGISYTNGANRLISTGGANFNGNDSVVLYYDSNADGTLTPAEIVDVIPFTNVGNEGADKSFHRISNTQGFDLTAGTSVLSFPAVWELKTLAEVAAATPADAFYLQGAVLPVSLTPTVSSFAEDAGATASVVTVSVPYNVTANTTVTLAVTVSGSPDATEISIPASVVILSGTNSITFDVAALTDSTADGNQVATITATATGFTNGTTNLTVTDVDGSSYASWQSSKFTALELANPLISGDNADPDGDGLSNALEYAFGTEPKATTAATYLPQSQVVAGALKLSYRRPVNGVSGVTYSIQANGVDLTSGGANWTTATPVTDYSSVITPNGDGTETVEITFAGTVSGKKFGRVFVSF